VSTTDIRSGGQNLLNARQRFIDAGVKALHLHVDVDVLDPEISMANSYSVPGGLLTDEVVSAIQSFKEKIPIASAVISAYDPAYDVEGKMLRAIDDIINSIIR
jgi:arginase